MLAHYQRPNFVFERRNPDGRWDQVFDMRTQDGTFIGVRVDITEHKEREKALRRSMRKIELFRHVLDDLPVATYVKSDDLAFEFVNKAWSVMTGVSKEEAIGHTDRDFFGDEGIGFAGRDEEVIRSGETIENEESLTHRDGTQRQLIARKSRLLASDGAIHLIGSSIDISELKAAREGAAGGAAAGGTCRPGEVRVPGQYEPRDPYADERGTRHGRTARQDPNSIRSSRPSPTSS